VRPLRDGDLSPPSSAEVKNRVELSIPLLSLRAFVAYERVKPTYLPTFSICRHTRFHMSNGNTSSAVAIKRKAKENFRTAVLLILAYSNRDWLFFRVYYHASYQFLNARERSFAAILQVRSSSMFLLILIVGNDNVRRSDIFKSFNVHTTFLQNRSSGRN
jgi:hypothetical protein